MGDDVDGLVVDVKQAEKAAPGGEQGSVAGQDVRVELKMWRHLMPLQEANLALHHLLTTPAGAILTSDYPQFTASLRYPSHYVAKETALLRIL